MTKYSLTNWWKIVNGKSLPSIQTVTVHIKRSISQRRNLVLHKNIDYESLLSFVQDNPNAGISLTISESEFDQAIKTIISALITNETPPTQLVSYLKYRTHHIYIEFVDEATLEINTIEG